MIRTNSITIHQKIQIISLRTALGLRPLTSNTPAKKWLGEGGPAIAARVGDLKLQTYLFGFRFNFLNKSKVKNCTQTDKDVHILT